MIYTFLIFVCITCLSCYGTDLPIEVEQKIKTYYEVQHYKLDRIPHEVANDVFFITSNNVTIGVLKKYRSSDLKTVEQVGTLLVSLNGFGIPTPTFDFVLCINNEIYCGEQY